MKRLTVAELAKRVGKNTENLDALAGKLMEHEKDSREDSCEHSWTVDAILDTWGDHFGRNADKTYEARLRCLGCGKTKVIQHSDATKADKKLLRVVGKPFRWF